MERWFNFLNELRFRFWSNVAPRLLIVLRDRTFSHPNSHRLIRRLLFPPAMRPSYDFFNFRIDDEKARFIKSCNATNRGLALIFKQRYPDTNVEAECQYDGHWLTRYAADYLNDQEIVN